MRQVGLVITLASHLCPSLGRLKRLTWPILTALCLLTAVPAFAAEPIAVFPTTSYDAFLIYESLAVFWLAIISLLVIIRMKLREIERTQALGADREDADAPLLQ